MKPLRLAEYIEKLKVKLAEEGDIILVHPDTGGGGHLTCHDGEIELVLAKEHYGGFFRVDSLGGRNDKGAFIQPYQSKIEKRPTVKVLKLT